MGFSSSFGDCLSNVLGKSLSNGLVNVIGNCLVDFLCNGLFNGLGNELCNGLCNTMKVGILGGLGDELVDLDHVIHIGDCGEDLEGFQIKHYLPC